MPAAVRSVGTALETPNVALAGLTTVKIVNSSVRWIWPLLKDENFSGVQMAAGGIPSFRVGVAEASDVMSGLVKMVSKLALMMEVLIIEVPVLREEDATTAT